jgi:hypothetical protein
MFDCMMTEIRGELGIVRWVSNLLGKDVPNLCPLCHFYEDEAIGDPQMDRYGDLRYIVGYTDESPSIPPEIITVRVRDNSLGFARESIFDLDFFNREKPVNTFNKETYWRQKSLRLSRRLLRQERRERRKSRRR